MAYDGKTPVECTIEKSRNTPYQDEVEEGFDISKGALQSQGLSLWSQAEQAVRLREEQFETKAPLRTASDKSLLDLLSAVIAAWNITVCPDPIYRRT